MRIGVVIPTIQGREQLLERTLEAFWETSPLADVIVEHGHPSCGDAWNAGARKLPLADYIFFGADDTVPHHGWAQAAVTACAKGALPATTLLRPDGAVEAHGSYGDGRVIREAKDGDPCRQSAAPFVTRAAWDAVGEFLPIHYYSDDNWYCRARAVGYHVHVCTGLRMTHHETRGDSDINLHAMAHRQAHLDHCAQLGISTA